jgi:beta-glucanase (GH16 family)
MLASMAFAAIVQAPVAAASAVDAASSAPAPQVSTVSKGGIGQYADLSPAFDATFAGTSLDTSQWQTCYPWSDTGSGCTNFGNSQEEEWYLPSQDEVSGGALHLVATALPTPGKAKTGSPKTYPYRSGMVTTYSSFDFTYGYVQVVARLPGGTGTWPALWLLPQSQAWPPEIDMMENWGTSSTIRTTLHWSTPSGPQQAGEQVTSPTSLTTGWHTYGLLWEPGSITWYLDGEPVDSYTGSAVPSQPMYFLANLAIDGPAASSSSFDIQSVQIYDSSSEPSSTLETGGPTGSTPTGSTPSGYELAGADGGIFAFGTAQFHGSMGGRPLNAPIVGMANAPTGQGYWEVASDGGIFAFGSAAFDGSMGGKPLNAAVVGMAAVPTGRGYWEEAGDGGIFAFGTAQFRGSMGGKALNAPEVGIASS